MKYLRLPGLRSLIFLCVLYCAPWFKLKVSAAANDLFLTTERTERTEHTERTEECRMLKLFHPAPPRTACGPIRSSSSASHSVVFDRDPNTHRFSASSATNPLPSNNFKNAPPPDEIKSNLWPSSI